MKISDVGLQLIAKYEGCHLDAYLDPVGIPTIGYGHTAGVKMGMKISKDEALGFLRQDVFKAENSVNKYLNKYNFSQNEFDALVSFAFNVGSIDGLTAKGTRNKQKIAQMMLQYVYAKGKKLKGLEARRAAEYSLFTSGAMLSDHPDYEKGKTYILQKNIVVRIEPHIAAAPVGYEGLSKSAQKHDSDKNGSLDAGTKVTCKDVFVDSNNNVWIKCPSGWLAAYYNKGVLIK